MVNNKPHKQNKTNPPRRAYTPPNTAASVLFVILSLTILFSYGNPYSEAFFVFLFSWWYIPLWLFTSYYFGLTVAKTSHSLIAQNPKLVSLKMLGIEVIMTIFQFLTMIIIHGYPIQYCTSANCSSVNIFEVMIALIIGSIISFIPAYYAIFRYSKWYRIISNNKKVRKKDYPGAIFG